MADLAASVKKRQSKSRFSLCRTRQSRLFKTLPATTRVCPPMYTRVLPWEDWRGKIFPHDRIDDAGEEKNLEQLGRQLLPACYSLSIHRCLLILSNESLRRSSRSCPTAARARLTCRAPRRLRRSPGDRARPLRPANPLRRKMASARLASHA